MPMKMPTEHSITVMKKEFIVPKRAEEIRRKLGVAQRRIDLYNKRKDIIELDLAVLELRVKMLTEALGEPITREA